jgi:hypothetical protein
MRRDGRNLEIEKEHGGKTDTDKNEQMDIEGNIDGRRQMNKYRI